MNDIEKNITADWDSITGEELAFLFLDKGLVKSQIAELYNVNIGQVSYKLKKFNINGQKQMIKDSINDAIHDLKQDIIKDLIFTEDCLLDDENNTKVVWGAVKVSKGEHQGRIGYYDDEDNTHAYVYWGNMVSSLDSYSRIPLSYITNKISTYDLVKRGKELSNLINQMRAKQQITNSPEKYKEITNLYGEYVLIMELLNKIYVDTFYLENQSSKNVFLSYSSKDKEMATILASDLKRAKYHVWFDTWEISGGHSIPEEISKGIEKSDALIMLISKNYLTSVFCRDEWQSFYMKFNTSKPNAIIPIILDESEPPALIASRKYLKLSESYPYEYLLNDLKRALKKL